MTAFGGLGSEACIHIDKEFTNHNLPHLQILIEHKQHNIDSTGFNMQCFKAFQIFHSLFGIVCIFLSAARQHAGKRSHPCFLFNTSPVNQSAADKSNFGSSFKHRQLVGRWFLEEHSSLNNYNRRFSNHINFQLRKWLWK